MNKKIYHISLLTLVFFTKSFAIDYKHLMYWDIADLPGPAYPLNATRSEKNNLDKQYVLDNQKVIEANLKAKLLKYHPDKAKNFIEKHFFANYAKVLIEAKKELIEEKKAGVPSPDKIKETAKFDFYLLMREQVVNNRFDKDKIRNFFNDIRSLDFSELKKIVDGISDIIDNRPLSGPLNTTLATIENHLTYNTAGISPENISNITNTIINSFFYSYLSKKIRDTSIEALIKVSQTYKSQNNIPKAQEILKELKNIIQTEWSALFPINDTHKDEIESLQAELEITKIPEKTLSAVKNLVSQAKLKFAPNEFNPLYSQAVAELNPYLPTSAPNILKVYLTWAEKFIEPSVKAYTLYIGSFGSR